MATNTRNMSATGNSVNASTSTAKASVELTTEVFSAVDKLEDLGECYVPAKKTLFTDSAVRVQEGNSGRVLARETSPKISVSTLKSSFGH